MNMIIANINERKSELALRVAFGASMNEIRNMLVTETCILCLSAGLVGVAVGLGITMIIASMAGLTLVIQWATLIKSLVFCTFVGVAASQYPSHLVKRIPVAYLLKGE
jgi:putative ABC transport system permease protein